MKTFFLGVLLIVLLGVMGFVLSLTGQPTKDTQEKAVIQDTAMQKELVIEDTAVGQGAEAVPGSLLVVHYTGTLQDGTKFDSSLDRGEPFQFVLGQGSVIQGWEQGFAGMKVGGKRTLTVPPELGYGANGVPGAIPPDSTLYFDVELVDVITQ